ncbi:MAG: hypothetical protein GX120_09795 [Methanosarcina mazei]|nr:hypothetical protein [Methanosarcina mazei]
MLRNRKVGVNILITAVLIMDILFMPVVSAYENPTWNSTLKKSASYNGVYAYTAANVGYFGPVVYNSARGAYTYTFRITGLGETRTSSGGSTAECRIQTVDIREVTNNANQAIWTSDDPQYIGAWPRPDGNSAYYANVAYTISSLAISAISSYANYAISAATLVASLRSGYDDETNGETVRREWEYSPDKTDVSYFFWWIHDVKPGQTVKFSVENCLFGPYYECVDVSKTYSITAPSRAPSKMTEAEKKKYGIEVIPINELEERSSELNLAPEVVEELIKYGEPVYVAHNLTIEEVVLEGEPADKEELISELVNRTGYSREELLGPVNPFGNITSKKEESLS